MIGLTDDAFDNRVISLNRRGVNPARFLSSVFGGLGKPRLDVERVPPQVKAEVGGPPQAIIYCAPGKGLFHRTMLEQLADTLVADIGASAVPDLLVGHKLTVEGLCVRRMAGALGIPYAVTIQGDTDTKILHARPDLSPALHQVFHEAATVVSFAPWSLSAVEAKLGKRSGPVAVIPCPTDLDEILRPNPDGSGLVSVFHLASARRKNLALLVQAMELLHRQGRSATLSIVGGGSESDMAQAREIIGATRGIRLEGPLDRATLAARLNRAAGFVLPSKRETFGLVFTEALFAGCPIIYPEDRAVAGYFDDCTFAMPVSPRDAAGLARAMADLLDRQAELKAALGDWQANGEAQRFTRPAIAQAYTAALRAALGAGEAV
ncbi:MAG: glycosyltransferase [Erythrobacter sp.]|nr:MAG: glycosyltransferase [Erythrobacter sp.]